MKRITVAIVLLITILYFFEANDSLGLRKYKPLLDVAHASNGYLLSWSKLSYFTYYEIEVLNRATGNKEQQLSLMPAYRIVKYRTFENSIKIDQNFPESSYLRVSAHSLFHHPLGFYSDLIPMSEINFNPDNAPLKAIPTINFPPSAPASNIPLVKWTSIPGAVYYEIEFLNELPENPNEISHSRHQIYSSRNVYTNGYSINLSKYNDSHIYWRVRALDYNGNPIGVFSDATEIFIDHTLTPILKPVSNTGFKIANVPMPLYPLYSWIPITGAVNYEVELTQALPENPNGIQPSKYQIRHKIVHGGTDCYDEAPLIIPGTYYWRVRGLDENGQPVGVYSDAEQFTVNLASGNYAATFGDSITHGGGAISYSPADVEYSFQTYLSFPTANLGKSGDTSEAMLNRFNKDVLPYKPKFLIIMGGSNSLRGGVPATQVIKELTGIRDKCLAHGIRPIFLTLPPINPDAISRAFEEETVPNWQNEFSTVNSFIRQQRYYIDIEPYFLDANRNLPDNYAIDGLHLDIDGKKLMAQIINANWTKVTK